MGSLGSSSTQATSISLEILNSGERRHLLFSKYESSCYFATSCGYGLGRSSRIWGNIYYTGTVVKSKSQSANYITF